MSYKKKEKKVSGYYQLPLFILLINQGVSLVFRSTSEIAFQDDPSQLFIRGGAYLLALGIFFKHYQQNMRLLSQKKMFCILVIYFISSVMWSFFPVKVVINWGHFLGMMLSIIAARYYFKEYRDKMFPFFATTLTLLVTVSLFFVFVFPAIGIDQEGRWQGVAGNANSYGIITIASIWASLSVLYTKKDRRWFYWMLLVISVVAMLGSGSKTSLIVSMFIFLSMYVLVKLEKASLTRKIFVLVGCGFFVIVFYLIVFITMPQLLGIEGATGALGRDATLSGRTVVWEFAWKVFLIKPMHGWGFDSNMSVLKYFGGGVGQFHSGYFDLLVRGGIVGFFVAGLLMVNLIKRLLTNDCADKRHGMLFLSLVLAILIHNISEASLLRGTSLFWMLVVFPYFLFDKKQKKDG